VCFSTFLEKAFVSRVKPRIAPLPVFPRVARKTRHFDGNASPDFASAHPGYEVERAEVVVQSAEVPVMAIFLRGGVLLGGDARLWE
jgi:hypothetical protein